MEDSGGLGRQLMEDLAHGIRFNVRYVGSLPIITAMKSLDFSVRTAIAKECINRVCQAANFIPGRREKRKKEDISDLVGNGQVDLRWTGKDVTLIVSGESLSVVEGGKTLFTHPMPNISFASGGDEETGEFVCYVGKSEEEGRRCIVFESGVSQASNLLAAIGHAFKFRYFNAQPSISALSSFNRPSQSSIADPPPRPSPIIKAQPIQSNPLAPTGLPTIPQSQPLLTTSLESQPWYHGEVSRQEAEALLTRDGDFLVRQSGQGHGQYVLSGQQGGTPKHLLLIDTDGKVRTKDREFVSVPHLIAYHRENNLPITSQESALLLLFPILKR